jgi:hypothetical protein
MSLILASRSYDRQIYNAIRKSISARALDFGPPPSVAPASPTPVRSGPQVSLASLSPQQAKAMGLLTSGTCGPNSSISPSSAALKSSLASRLRQKTDLLGSTLFNLTWKERDTPQQRSIPALRASVRRTSVSDFTGWPTPNLPTGGPNVKSTAKHTGGMDLDGAVTLAGWPTPTLPSGGQTPPEGTSATGMTPDGRKVQVTLKDVANLASWPTTRSSDAEKNVRTLEGSLSEIDRKGSPQDLCMAFCADGPARLTASGHLVTGYSAETVSGDQLNPDHSRWLMACPVQWAQAAPNYDDWQRWQDLMRSLSPEQKNIALGRSAPTATQ